MPLLARTAKDVMVPLGDYPVVRVDESLKTAVEMLSKAFLDPAAQFRHRTILVLDGNQKLVGILDFRSILGSIIPWRFAGLFQERTSMGTAAALAESGFEDLGVESEGFHTRVKSKAEVKVGDVMLKIRGAIQGDCPLLKAVEIWYRNKVTVLPVYQGDELAGVLRDIELFLATAEVLRDGRAS